MNGEAIETSTDVDQETTRNNQETFKDAPVVVPYLVKLLLQYENSPFMEDTDLVHCQQMLRLAWSIDSSGSYMCVACGRRIVVFSTSNHTHPLYFLTAVTPSPQELVTSVLCMVVDSDTVMVLVGTTDGWLHIHHPSLQDDQVMTSIHAQKVHHGALSGIHLRDTVISIDTPDGVVLIDLVDVLSARQWFLKSRQMPHDVLPARVFEFYTVGHRNTTQVYGHLSNGTKSLYDHMMALNSSGREDESKILVLSAGKDPPLAWYSLNGSKSHSRGILSSLVAMSSRMMFGYNRKANIQDDSGERHHHHVLEQQEIDQGYTHENQGHKSRHKKNTKNAMLASPYTNIWDDPKRECFELTLCHSKTSHAPWAACCDSLGRVLVIQVQEQAIYKMLKGYRDCQLAWIQSSDYKEPLLLIYAPKRRTLELWDVCGGTGTKVQGLSHKFPVTDMGVLISCDRDSQASSIAFLFDLRTCVIHRVSIS